VKIQNTGCGGCGQKSNQGMLPLVTSTLTFIVIDHYKSIELILPADTGILNMMTDATTMF